MHLKLVCLALACGCVARGSPAVIGDPRTQPMPGHDMTAMDHDASAMSRSHSLAEIAFLFRGRGENVEGPKRIALWPLDVLLPGARCS